jgi:alanyl-tRNA synthetase
LPEENNRWSPGPVGPCGPDTEIYYRVGASEFPPAESNVQNDEDNRLEIWNNVFMEYYRDENGQLTKLSKQNVDTGMGFERMCCVLQQKASVYDTDLFEKTLQVIVQTLQLSLPFSPAQQRRVRIIADHARTAFMLINDGLVPSNVGAGYVLRMIIRRMVYNVMLLHPLQLEAYADVLHELLASFQGLRTFDEKEIIRVFTDEVKLFQKTLQTGKKMLEEMLNELAQT